jgi:gamma-glutamyl hydrolase
MIIFFFNFIFLIKIILPLDYNEYKPIIGIFANPSPESDHKFFNKTYVPLSYIRWLESYGAEVMVIQEWYDYKEIDDILKQINGILFTGGGRDFNLSSTWELKVIYTIEKGNEYKIPIWGTCMGFQLINVLLSRNEKILIQKYNDSSVAHGIIFTNNTKNSRMFHLFNESNLKNLEENSTLYFHSWGFDPETYMKTNLTTIFYVTSTAEDNDDSKFINSIEGIKNKIYGTQFHPEKIPYIRQNSYKLKHDNKILRVSNLLGAFFIEEARQNNNTFKGKKSDFYFINSYSNKTNYCGFNENSETYFFCKPQKKSFIFYIVFIILGVIILGILIWFCIFKRAKSKENNLVDSLI